MTPQELVTLRDGIFHTQREFAALLSQLRGVEVAPRTVEGWELGRNTRPIPLYLTDVSAIKAATTPHGEMCEQCEDVAIVRKNHVDLCRDCAAPLHQGGR